MFSNLGALLGSWRYHILGMRAALHNRTFFMLCGAPFLLALLLYGCGFYLFVTHAETLLGAIWSIDPNHASQATEWLYWLYEIVVALILYLLLLALMFYSFTVAANLIAAPVWDYVSHRYQKLFHPDLVAGHAHGGLRGTLVSLKEEFKKAVLILLAPLPFMFVPVVGPFLTLLVASAFIAWDYIDYSLSRDRILLRDRLDVVWRFKYHFIGFGLPMMVPVFNLVLMPFAILGATRLYYEAIRPKALLPRE